MNWAFRGWEAGKLTKKSKELDVAWMQSNAEQ